MEQKAEELYENGLCTSQITVSIDEQVFMVLKYTETDIVLETIVKKVVSESEDTRNYQAGKQ